MNLSGTKLLIWSFFLCFHSSLLLLLPQLSPTVEQCSWTRPPFLAILQYQWKRYKYRGCFFFLAPLWPVCINPRAGDTRGPSVILYRCAAMNKTEACCPQYCVQPAKHTLSLPLIFRSVDKLRAGVSSENQIIESFYGAGKSFAGAYCAVAGTVL